MSRMNRNTLIAWSILFVAYSIDAQRTCEQRSCYPATGDLLVGREKRLYASSTCGMRRPVKYCIVGFLLNTEKCFYCDSRSIVDSRPDGHVFSHLPKYMVSTSPDTRLDTWWQAENGMEKAFIQLDLEAEFHFTHLIMTFKTFRPAGMIVEKSADFGRTWKEYRYFASDCDKIFPGIKKGPQQKIDDVICEERYSQVEPSTQGEVVMKVLDPLIPVENPYSLEVQNLLKLTNLKISFTKLHSLGDDILDAGSNVQQKYYYSLYEMVIRGSCSCYGHAEECIPVPGAPNDPNMVHGQCKCTHFTQGRNCEKCLDDHWDLPWRPALGDQTNACKKCNCHDHATRCHFDVAVYESTGEVSGGVCDDCKHNTTGRQCNQCIALFYRDPTKTLVDPDVCLPCNCDPAGSVGGGECETTTDFAKGTIAGHCICKENVRGKRCDQCKDGHWNLLESDSKGCQSCDCDSRGTVGNNLCNSVTGQCICKRFVQGTRCNQCYDGFWGVGSSVDGCKPCACDLGGSYSNTCDKITGACSCRPNIVGRKCDQVRPGYFFALPGQDTFEGEDAIPSKGVFRKVKGDLSGIGTPFTTWTGSGFAAIPPNAAVDFTMVTVPDSGDYDVYIRYRSKDDINWENVVLAVSRTDGRDLRGGPCNEPFLQKTASAYLPANRDVARFQPSFCLQKGLVYNLKLSLPPAKRTQRGKELLVDSIFLVPRPSAISIFYTREGELLKKTYLDNKCDSYFISLTPSTQGSVPQACLDVIFSISANTHDGALECQCDPVGTKANGSSDVLVCEPAGGQCPCKPNVIARKCDHCAPEAYGFGLDGCKLCGCDLVGSTDRYCDAVSGQCKCDGLVQGLQCERCPPAYFGFPSCEPCDCSNHSETCDLRTGVCLNCKDNTAGPDCGKCAPGYYGDASIGLPTDCQRCQCPGGSSGNQFSSTCSYKVVNGIRQVACDNCQPGYTGQLCEKCADGYFGNPLIGGGSCVRCNCSGNISPFAAGKCDGVTGECFNCLHNTEGFNCERCKSGTFGDALKQDCTECVCNNQGTDYSDSSICDRSSGQCSCLMNVGGKACDKCLPGHWNLASGLGCEQCNCSSNGSLVDQCNQLDGQCKCRAGFGGQQCTECEDFFWGNPHKKCSACLCNPAGSESLQCDRQTGQCRCKPGVVGQLCDMCDSRTTGLMPKCERCHPCYDQWDDTIDAIHNNWTSYVVPGSAGNVTLNVTGLTYYDRQIKNLLLRLEALNRLLNLSVTPNDVNSLRQKVVDLHLGLKETGAKRSEVLGQLKNVSRRNEMASDDLLDLAARVKGLERESELVIANLTEVAESNLDGALNSTLASLKRSREAQALVTESKDTLVSSKKLRDSIHDQHYASNDSSLPSQTKQHLNDLDMLSANVSQLGGLLKKLNELLCGPSDNCGMCNASSCEMCGTSPNCTGVRSLAQEAVDRALDAKLAVEKKEGLVRDSLDQLGLLDVDVQATLSSAEEAVMSAADAHQRNEMAVRNITILINDILAFLNQSFVHPNETRMLVKQTLSLNISLTPEEIKDLAEQIKVTVANLTGVSAILEASKDDLAMATNLLKEAEMAKLMAEKVMNDTMDVVDGLTKTNGQLSDTRVMLTMTANDIEKAKDVIMEVRRRNADLEALLKKALRDVIEMENTTVPAVAAAFKDNRQLLSKTEAAGANATRLLNAANQTSSAFMATIEYVEEKIANKNNSTEDARRRTLLLAKKTEKLYEVAQMKLNQLEALQLRYSRIEEREKDVSEELMKLDKQITVIVGKLRKITVCHESCNPVAADFCTGLVV